MGTSASYQPGYVGPSTSGYGTCVVGEKYEPRQYLSAADLAKRIRADLKAAQKAGDLPGKAQGIVYRVRSHSYSGGQSVRVVIEHIDQTGPYADSWARVPIADDDHSWEASRARDYGMTTILRPDVAEWGTKVRALMDAYTRRDVDSMTDYFNVSCYMQVTLASGACL